MITTQNINSVFVKCNDAKTDMISRWFDDSEEKSEEREQQHHISP
jgi:hypothetical protein